MLTKEQQNWILKHESSQHLIRNLNKLRKEGKIQFFQFKEIIKYYLKKAV
jgi:hypothetical protein